VLQPVDVVEEQFDDALVLARGQGGGVRAEEHRGQPPQGTRFYAESLDSS
jgi:hypothetical protein